MREDVTKLPEWSPRLVEEDDHLRLRNEYTVSEETVSLCDEHYGSLSTGERRGATDTGGHVTPRTEQR